MTEKDLLFERLLDLTEQIRLENDPKKMTTQIQDLNEVLVRMLELQNRERLDKSLARAAKPNF